MRSVKPEELYVHRVFFTEFDQFGNAAELANDNVKEKIRLDLERKIKLLNLTKGHIVVAATHLVQSSFAHDILLEYPGLIQSGAIIPSIKWGHENAQHFLDSKRHEQSASPHNSVHTDKAQDLTALIDGNGTAVRWEVGDMSFWYRDRLSGDLADPKGFLRSRLVDEGVVIADTTYQDLANQLGEIKVLSRETARELTRKFNIPHLENALLKYSDFLYYLSGARTTKSEGVLPQENLMDFSLNAMAQNRSRLSEHEIFFKIFMNLVKLKTKTVFPDNFIDSISIEDSLKLREMAISERFVDKYNTIQVKTKEALNIADPEKLVLRLEELSEFEVDIHQEYESSLDSELSVTLRKERKKHAKNIICSIASLLVDSFLLDLDEMKSIIVSTLHLTGKKEIAKQIEEKEKSSMRAFDSMLKGMHGADRQVFLDFVKNMNTVYQGSML